MAKKELKKSLTLRIKDSTREILEEAAEEKKVKVTSLVRDILEGYARRYNDRKKY